MKNGKFGNIVCACFAGKGNSYVVKHCKRRTNYIFIRKVKNKMRKTYSEPMMEIQLFAESEVIMASIFVDAGDFWA